MTPGQRPPFHRESLEGCTMGSLRTLGWGVIGPGAPPLLGEVRRWPRIQAPVWLKAVEEGAPLPAHRKGGPTGFSGTQSGSLQSSKILTSQPPADCLGAPAPLRSRPLDHHSPPLRREAEGEHAMAAAKPPRPSSLVACAPCAKAEHPVKYVHEGTNSGSRHEPWTATQEVGTNSHLRKLRLKTAICSVTGTAKAGWIPAHPSASPTGPLLATRVGSFPSLVLAHPQQSRSCGVAGVMRAPGPHLLPSPEQWRPAQVTQPCAWESLAKRPTGPQEANKAMGLPGVSQGSSRRPEAASLGGYHTNRPSCTLALGITPPRCLPSYQWGHSSPKILFWEKMLPK